MAYHYHTPAGYMKEYEYPRIEEWNLISAGPSIRTLKPSDLLEGATICAVNRAVLKKGIRAQYWSLQENPGQSRRTIFDCELEEPAIVWGNIGFETDWQKIAKRKREKGRGNLIPVLNDRNTDAFNKDMPWKTELPWAPRPITTTLGIIMKHGAKRVRVFGVDMVGDVEYTGNACFTPFATGEGRWVTERKAWAACIEEARSHGVEIEWTAPAS